MRQKVYTVNGRTNVVDEWDLVGTLPGENEKLKVLSKGKRMCILPARCVFSDKAKALEIANK